MAKQQVKCENCHRPKSNGDLFGIKSREMVICGECAKGLQLEVDSPDELWLMYRLIAYKQKAKAEAGARSRMWGDLSLREI